MTVNCMSSVQSVKEIDKEVVATVIVKDTYNQMPQVSSMYKLCLRIA